jgi:hypothetical protein
MPTLEVDQPMCTSRNFALAALKVVIVRVYLLRMSYYISKGATNVPLSEIVYSLQV